jgi:phospholipid/cholesterol/gamma-HCH transport system substrate-binding protein
MGAAIRKHLRDFLAVSVLVVIGLAVTLYIVQNQRLRVPVLQERPFELKAEFETAQAVVPGQGQTIRVAGVRVGDVERVELEDGKGVVTFVVDREYLPIYRDATILMRPTTGLKDMFFQLDPGTRAAGEYDEGDVIPVANTAPDVNPDEILEFLDSDTQAYLRLLLVGAGKGLEGRDRELGRLLGGLGPINRNLDRLNRMVATRKESLARSIHNFNRLTQAVGQANDDLAELIVSQNQSLGAIAEQDVNVERWVRLLPGTLRQARQTLEQLAEFGAELGPAFDELRPFARNLEAMNESIRTFSLATTPVIRDEVRPFVRAARPVIPDLRRAAGRWSRTTPRLTTIGEKINRLANMAAYNPRGAEPAGTPGRAEGYLYWAGWLAHNSNLVFSTGDGHGTFRRIYFTATCGNLRNIITGGDAAETNPVQAALGQAFRGAVTGVGPLVAEAC